MHMHRLGIRLSLIAFACWWIGSLASSTAAKDYFVDAATGSDRSACISTPGPSAAACKSISYAIQGADLGAGDRVRIASGTYRETLEIATGDSGTAANPVVFLGEGDVAVEGLDPTPLDDAQASSCTAELNCGGNGLAYPHVYRFARGNRTVEGIIETVWTPVRVDDSTVTGVVFDLTKPIPSKMVSTVADVEKFSGSYMVAGDYIFVHTYQDVAPSRTANDVEVIKRACVVNLTEATGVRLENLTFRYGADQVIQLSNSHDIELRSLNVHSASGLGININSGSDNVRVRDVEVSHVWGRKEFTLPQADSGSCFTAACGWYNRGGGTGFKIDGGGAGRGGFDVRGLTAYNAWNVVSIEQVKNSTFQDVLAKNSPNHTFIMFDKVDSPNCRDNVLKGILAFNGQDSVYIAGCQNSRSIRSSFNHWFQGKTDVNSPSTGWRVRGVLGSRGIGIAADSVPGFTTDYNFMEGTDAYCKITYPQPTGTKKYDCDGTAWKDFGYDGLSRHAGVRLAGFTAWPPQNGLEMSRKVRRDFYPVAGSSTIDAGDPDLDGDGVLETGPGGDDECTAVHNCSGAGPDIGPFEYGITVANGSVGGNPPDVQTAIVAPVTARRDDIR